MKEREVRERLRDSVLRECEHKKKEREFIEAEIEMRMRELGVR